MLKIITVNVNGIRAAARKGFFEWLKKMDADVVCVQETKAQEHQLEDEIFHPKGYEVSYVDAIKKGYSGVALYAKEKPSNISRHLGFETSDNEGRFVQYDFKTYSVISVYMPSGSSSEERQAVKFDYLDKMEPVLQKLKKSKNPVFICGDWNIAHKEIDLKNWRANQKNSGFLPGERAWLDKVFGKWGWVDSFRVVNEEPEQYTWWSNRGQAWSKNVGWRIDYQIVSPSMKDKIVSADIYKDERFSDHAPLIMTYDL